MCEQCKRVYCCAVFGLKKKSAVHRDLPKRSENGSSGIIRFSHSNEFFGEEKNEEEKRDDISDLSVLSFRCVMSQIEG